MLCHLSCRACIFLSVFLATQAFAADQMVWTEYPEFGVALGQGYNLLEDRPATGTCVDFVPVQDPSQSVQYRFDEVTSNTDVRSVTNISASGSMKMAILKATARLSFLSDESFKLDTQKFLLTANVANSSLFAAPSIDFKKAGEVVGQAPKDGSPGKDYSMNTKIKLKDGNDNLNSEKCGQGFVAAIISGASLDAFLTMTKSDAESLSTISGGLEANIGGVFSVNGDFSQKQTSSKIQANTSVSVFKSGGSGGQIAYDLAGLKAAVAGMPVEAATTPKPIRIAILPYTFLDKAPEAKSYSAMLVEQAVAAYFLLTDVFHNTQSVIDSYQHFSEYAAPGQPLYIKQTLKSYVDLNARSLLAANRLSKVLSLCQEQLIATNRTLANLPNDIAESAAQDLAAGAIGVVPSQENKRHEIGQIPDVASIGPRVDDLFAKAESSLSTSAKTEKLSSKFGTRLS